MIRLIPAAGLLLILSCAMPSAAWSGTREASIDDLILGEAHYMAGDLSAAAQRLSKAVNSDDAVQVQRAYYLLGRVSLLTGDFRQAKEYFERAADSGNGGSRWKALAGIGDALYASGRHEEALRRYRIAQAAAAGGVDAAVMDLKMALCEHVLGNEAAARRQLGSALARIPVLSGWVGREEEFYHSMSMIGIEVSAKDEERIYLLVGPVRGDFNADEVMGVEVPVREIRKGGRSYLEYGPLADEVEAMIFSEKIRGAFSFPVEIITR
ncbi:MAG: hypothetical protein JSV00_07565 [bacterium]|nr:MAG: hypothetical protein JSV00_07565 [bacterium]